MNWKLFGQGDWALVWGTVLVFALDGMQKTTKLFVSASSVLAIFEERTWQIHVTSLTVRDRDKLFGC